MNYGQIHQTIGRLGLSGDPALRSTIFVLEPIPCNNGCPLGLYDPGANTIILPPEYTGGALVHEIGHRLGHYYQHDLSEAFAEAYRKQHMGGQVALAYRGAGSLDDLVRFEPLWEEEESGRVVFYFDRPLTVEEQVAARGMLEANPQLVASYHPYSGGSTLSLDFTKGQPQLLLILGIGAVLIAGMLGFGIFKIQAEIANKLIPLALIGGGVFILYGLTQAAMKRS